MASLAFTPGAATFSGNVVRRRKDNFPVHGFPTTIRSSVSVTVKCYVSTTNLMVKIKEKFKGKNVNSLTVEAADDDMPSNLCIIDTLQRLGIDRYFQPQVDSVLDHAYKLWQGKEKDTVYSDISIHAMAFRLLRVKGYQVSSEELDPYIDVERMKKLKTVDVPTVIELYRAAQERMYEEEGSLERLHVWSTNFLMHQLQANSIPDEKLHKLVEYYLKNYHGILDRVGVRRNLDLFDISHYPTLRARVPNLCTEDFLSFAKEDFNTCQAQHQKEHEQLQRWFEDCRFDTLKFGRETAVGAAHFLSSAILGESELCNVRLALAKHMVLVVFIDDFFDHYGSREDSFKILHLLKEWKEKPAGEYGSEEVEILFTAVYNTVNELAEMAHVEQGRNIKGFLIELWVEIVSIFKIELDTWSNDTTLTLDEYLSSSWVSVGCRICILVSMQLLGVQLTDEMLLSDECINLCKHVSMVDRLLNDVGTFEKERKENTGNSVSLLLAAAVKEGRPITEEEAIIKIKKMAENERRKLMQIVYKRESVFPRKCKDMFLKVCRIGCYLYASGDEFTSPQKMKEDVKSLIYESL
uniref:Terpene synthase 3 n=1 Tax=Origanum majorana TaxID=268884 RepID=A0A3G6V9T9_ORIMA|nr:terpene synthase 3 [Origanum majorana]